VCHSFIILFILFVLHFVHAIKFLHENVASRPALNVPEPPVAHGVAKYLTLRRWLIVDNVFIIFFFNIRELEFVSQNDQQIVQNDATCDPTRTTWHVVC
jgi:hypothetical protein